ncbi:hypothetical protein [Alkanindiges illinoisensis]|uniref:DNA helicase IV N-terminal domain-containing protein n=1 Tax=Alkanindiges illinoisensis TaxID=197183 RepID=A0A4Y7XAF7_9GAMM|nr:hypothetical protein [Alkanindiges illinoisensis]TEU24915.1 hypothetical protein E2B99_11020 [Alkanindiges illinoisensis]
MHITPSLFSYLLNSQVRWQLSYQYPQLSLVQDSVEKTLGLDQQLNVEVTYGLFWANVQVLTANQTYLFKGVNKQKATEFKAVIQQDVEYFKLAKQSDALKAQLLPFLAQRS